MPLYALVDGQRSRAARAGPRRAACADCAQPMIAKTGDVVIWHWAHLAENPGCGAAGETGWHLEWKDLGPPGSQERAVGRRRADVLAPGGFAVEFQLSPLTAAEVTARERDWGGKLVWIFDAADAYQEGRLALRVHPDRRGDAYRNVYWAHAPERVRAARCRSFLDLGGDLILVGRWYDSSLLQGYGWQVTRDWVVAWVLNGTSIPPLPGFERPVNATGLRRRAATRAARISGAAWNERAARGHGACPLCEGEHASCTFTAGSLHCVTENCQNPHHVSLKEPAR
jgi:hypothetical protein